MKIPIIRVDFSIRLCWRHSDHGTVVASDIAEPRQLKDKRIGVQRFEDLTHMAAREAVKYLGLSDSDVFYLQIGGVPTRFAALQNLAVQGAILNPPYVGRAQKLGYRVDGDSRRARFRDLGHKDVGVAVCCGVVRFSRDREIRRSCPTHAHTGINLFVLHLGVCRDVSAPPARIIAEEVVDLAGELLESFYVRLRVGAEEPHAQRCRLDLRSRCTC